MKLHLGCGARYFPGWKHFDASDYPHLTGHSIINLPYADNSVDIIYSSHTIEYFDREEVKNLLLEWNRVLKSHGILRLAVPDFESMAKLYFSGMWSLDNFLGPLYGKIKSGDTIIYHKTVYDYISLKNLLENIGFKNVRYWDWRQVDHGIYDDCSQAYLPKMDKENGTLISLNLECEK